MRKRLVVFLLSVLVMLAAVNFFGLGGAVSVVTGSNYALLLFAVLVQVLIILLYAVRFRAFALKYRKLSLRDAFFISVVGNFVSLVTPVAKVGGQPLMIYLTKERIGPAKSSAVVVTDTIVDILSSLLLVVAVLVLFYGIIPYQIFFPLALFAAVALVTVMGFMKLFLSRDALSRMVDWFVERMRSFRKIDRIFHAHLFEKSFRLVLEDKKLMSAGMGLSFLIKFFELLRIYIVFAAIGLFLPPVMVLVVWSFMLLLLCVPWLPGSLGLVEFGTASAFILLGLTSSQAAGGVLLERLVSFWFVVAFSVVVVWFSRYRLRELMQLAEKK